MFWSQSKSRISALAPQSATLGRVSYPTAWLLQTSFGMQVMFEREQASVLSGASRLMTPSGGSKPVVRGRGVTRCLCGGGGDRSERGRPQIVRFDRVDNHGLHAIQRWAAQAIACRAAVRSDGWPGFQQLGDLVQCHERHITGHGRKQYWHPEFHWVNTLLQT